MRRVASALVTATLTLAAVCAGADEKRDKAKEEERLQNAATVMKEILNIPDGIPQDLLDKAKCVIVMPSVIKGAFVVGGAYGRGAMVCRQGKDYAGPWGTPAMYALEGGSFGFQLGGQATDFVFLIMNERGVDSLLRSKVKLGADASAAAGPKGRAAAADTDVYMRAEILTYSRSRGLFAGVSLEGSTLRPDGDGNAALYGESVSARNIVRGPSPNAPAAAHDLMAVLEKASPHPKPA